MPITLIIIISLSVGIAIGAGVMYLLVSDKYWKMGYEEGQKSMSDRELI
jgi:hypothetical protein